MSQWVEQVERLIVQRRLLTPGQPVLVAVSGGVDSMVLLHLMHQLAAPHGWPLAVAHFNHQLRGRSSDADQKFVAAAAEKLGLRFTTARADVRSYAKTQGVSIEMAARQLRHKFLATAALELGIHRVALAHHANDQIELFFLRLLRGASPEGLQAMRAKSPSPVEPKVLLVRPLLEISRAEIEALAIDRHICFREDKSNAQLQYQRNRLRHELLPCLRDKYQPALDKTIGRLITILNAESDFLTAATEAARESRAPFDTLHLAIQRRWLTKECLCAGISPEFELIERLRLHPDLKLMIGPEQVIWRDSKGRVRSRSSPRSDFNPNKLELRFDGNQGALWFGGLKITWSIGAWRGWPGGKPRPAAGVERFDADKLGTCVILRHWQPGDRFQPIGMGQALKVQDLFTNSKVPLASRRELVVAQLTSAQAPIFWIEGLRISELCKIDAHTVRCLEWRWDRTPQVQEGAD